MNWWGGVGDTGQHKAIRYHAQVDVLKQPFIWLMILSQQFWQGSAGQFSQPQRVSFIHSSTQQPVSWATLFWGWLAVSWKNGSSWATNLSSSNRLTQNFLYGDWASFQKGEQNCERLFEAWPRIGMVSLLLQQAIR